MIYRPQPPAPMTKPTVLALVDDTKKTRAAMPPR
jgi:hypothetical protein